MDALTLTHAVAELVTVLRNDSHRLHSNAQRLQVLPPHLAVRLINANGVLSLQHELDDVLSKENSASRRMMDVDNVMESLRRRVVELQGKLETEMATAAQLPDALDQVRRKGRSQQVVANASRAGL